MSHVHIIGAGLAGLSAAVEAVQLGHSVSVYEGAAQAGGRCRSYEDSHLGQIIDNGNHLVLSGNTSVKRYCDAIGADGFYTVETARFPFCDIKSGARWAININEGRFPSWVFSAGRRAPGTTALDYLPGLKMLFADQRAVIADLLDQASPAYTQFWEPLILAVLNTPLDQAAASLMRPVFIETLMKGGAHCRPMIARHSLADALIDPALTYLKAHGANVHFGCRVAGLELDGAINAISLPGETRPLASGEYVIVAVPSWQAQKLVPDLDPPSAGEGILNIHYAFKSAVTEPEFLGLVSSLTQWVFVRSDMASVTVSAAGRALAEQPDVLAARCWAEIAEAYGWPSQPLPPYRVIKEKRATFDQSPDGLKRRSGPETSIPNLFLAGDWTATGLPATIEGAIRSGARAVAALSAP